MGAKSRSKKRPAWAHSVLLHQQRSSALAATTHRNPRSSWWTWSHPNRWSDTHHFSPLWVASSSLQDLYVSFQEWRPGRLWTTDIFSFWSYAGDKLHAVVLDSYEHLEILTRNAGSCLSEKILSVHEVLRCWSAKQSHAVWGNGNPSAISMC